MFVDHDYSSSNVLQMPLFGSIRAFEAQVSGVEVSSLASSMSSLCRVCVELCVQCGALHQAYHRSVEPVIMPCRVEASSF